MWIHEREKAPDEAGLPIPAQSHQVERVPFPAFLSLFACRFSLALLEAGVLLALPPLSLPAMAASPTRCWPLDAARP